MRILDRRIVWGVLGIALVVAAEAMEAVRVDPAGERFVLADTGAEFRVWGVNYDRAESAAGSRLLEDFWVDEWDTVREDFEEIRDLGANVVRVHLQLGKFMKAPDQPDALALAQLRKMLDLAKECRLRIDLTGLGCYRKMDVPDWYDAMDESARWDVQARFWRAVAGACRGHEAVFCYNLMNEPIVSGKESDGWLAGELGGSYFVQRLTLQQNGRTGEEIAEAWVAKLTAAIRSEDPGRLITVGVIPWAMIWPNAKPVFYAPKVARHLDFVSIHLYPKSGELEKALKALAVYRIGKPLVIEEMFPLECSLEELDQFVVQSEKLVSGWIGFYWGKTAAEYEATKDPKPADGLLAAWIRYFQKQAPARRAP